jgi:exodeoxyribonuclease VII small subunit
VLLMPEPPESNSRPDPADLSFEEAFRRLGEMVESLENGGLPLAEATGLYEQGMALVQRCNQLLNETELKITQLKESYNASAALSDIDELEWDEDEDSET